MAGTALHPDVKAGAAGEVILACSFVANGASAPVASTFRGDCISTVVRDGTGQFTVTLKPGHTYRYVISAVAQMSDLAEGSTPAAARASIGPPINEGTNSPLALQVFTWDKAGTATDFTSRKVNVIVVCKNSLAGT